MVEADSITSSDQPGFDQTLQPRDRSDGNKNSEIQITSIASGPIFQLLNRAPQVTSGSPVVGPDGMVESGNGRVIGLRRAYGAGTADTYRAALVAEYPEAAGMRNPIVIARRITDVNREDFAYRSNKPATAAMSAVEEAQAEARMVDQGVLSLYRGGGMTTAANRDMVRALISKMPKADQNRLLTPEGGLSIEGVRRVQAAVFSRAYGDTRLLTRMAESTDDDMKSITNVLTDMAPRVARMRDQMERGQIAAEGDFIPPLIKAIQQIADIRARGMDLAEFNAVPDMLAEPISIDVQDIMAAMYNPAGNRLASKEAIQGFFDRAIVDAEKQDISTETMPGIEPPRIKTAAEIIRDARQGPADPEQASLFGSPEDSRVGNARSGQGAQGTTDGNGRNANAGTGQEKVKPTYIFRHLCCTKLLLTGVPFPRT